MQLLFRPSLSASVAPALIAISFCATAFGGDREKAFRSQLAVAAPTLIDFHTHIDGEGINSSHSRSQNGDLQTIRERVRFLLQGDKVLSVTHRAERSEPARGGREPVAVRAIGINSEYWFIVVKQSTESPWLLEMANTQKKDDDSVRLNALGSWYSFAAAPYVVMGVPIGEFFSRGQVKVAAVQEEERDNGKVLRVSFTYTPTSSEIADHSYLQPTWALRGGWVSMRHQQDWGVAASELSIESEPGNISLERASVEYATPHEPLSPLRRVTRILEHPKYVAEMHFDFERYKPVRDAEGEIRLSAFGLPEVYDVGTAASGGLARYWVAGIGVALLSVGLILRRRSNRKQATQNERE